MRGLIRFIFHFIILVLVIGIGVRWLVGRSYSDPEVHYFHIEEKSASGEENNGTEGLRFAVLSDLYNYVFEGGNGVIADRISDTSPDAVLICGNMISSDAEDTMIVENLIKSLSQIAPVYYAYGDQERGYVIRNGVLYREEAGENDVLCIYADGSMKVVDPSTATAQELLEQGVWQAFSFGPGLITDGEIDVALNTEVGKAKASNPRTAIGIIDDLHYVFVVSDGRSGESEGLSLYELASFMEQLGVQTAYNLDGGGSSTMVFQGEVVNNPSSGFRDEEREVSDIVYIG